MRGAFYNNYKDKRDQTRHSTKLIMVYDDDAYRGASVSETQIPCPAPALLETETLQVGSI